MVRKAVLTSSWLCNRVVAKVGQVTSQTSTSSRTETGRQLVFDPSPTKPSQWLGLAAIRSTTSMSSK